MKYNKAFKFRIYPTEDQKVLINKTFGCVRFVYNRMLADKIQYYEETGKKLNNTPAQYKTEFEWLKEVDSLALANAQLNLQTAYNNFFRDKKVGFPKFKSKKNHHNSYTTNCVNSNIRLQDGYLILPKIKAVKTKQHRAIPTDYTLKSVTISRTPTDKYFVSILYVYDLTIKAVKPIKSIGLDFSMHELFVSSEGEIADYPRYYRQSLEKSAREQRILSHRKKGSNRYYQQKCKIAKIHEKIANQRKDFLHKMSRQITNAYDVVCIEDLNMKSMSQVLNFGKSVSDNGWGMFSAFLAYKLAEQGKKLIKIDKWYPSSKTCHVCGHVYKDLKLSERKWTCACCNTTHNRDENASINIKNKGLEILTVSV